ncbi:hypothetical protein DRW03_06395 [Corallococcus sp. H22C18031201]|nr:hypothetical protein DRW03_06395 [Corallococcus sp. H22C18031201]
MGLARLAQWRQSGAQRRVMPRPWVDGYCPSERGCQPHRGCLLGANPTIGHARSGDCAPWTWYEAVRASVALGGAAFAHGRLCRRGAITLAGPLAFLGPMADGSTGVPHPPEQGSLFGEPAWVELVRFYEETYLARQRPGTRKTRKSMLRHSCAHFEAKGVTHPRAADWLSYLNSRVLSGEIMRSTANQHRKVFSHVYEFARDVEGQNSWRLLVNPFAQGRVPRWAEPQPAPRAMEKPGVTYPKLLEAAPDPLSRAFFSMARRHGTRLQETLGLRPSDLNLDRGTVHIRIQRKPTTVEVSLLKTDTSAAVLQLHPETAQLLREAARWRMAHPRGVSGREFGGVAGDLFVFPYFVQTTNTLMDTVCRVVSPEDFPRRLKGIDGGDAWHVFRHTFTMGLIDMGLGLDEIHDWLRHKNPATTTTYLNSLRGRAVGNRERMEALWQEEAQREAELRELAKPGLKLVQHRGR